MLDVLTTDVFFSICTFLDFESVLTFLQTSHPCAQYDTNELFNFLALSWWGAEFWERAARRSVKFSKPLFHMKAELKRIYVFQRLIYPTVWKKNDFYKFWSLQE